MIVVNRVAEDAPRGQRILRTGEHLLGIHRVLHLRRTCINRGAHDAWGRRARLIIPRLAGVAQLVEQLIRNQQVTRSSRVAGSSFH